jgi:GntR family transcriptional regulator/MocR family aminotransferase
MQALAPDHVVYAGTASKSLAPGIRLGWLVLPPLLVDEVVQAQALAVRNLSVVDQLTLAEVMRCGAYDRHIRRCRLAYRRRRDRLVAAVAAHAPSVRVRGIAAGLHAMLELPEGADELELVARAAQRGLAIEGLSEYGPGGARHDPALVVGYATPPEHGYSAALAQLVAVLAEL